VVVAITNEKPEEARAFLEKNPFPFPVLYDPKGTAITAYQVQGIPVTCLVDREGKLVDAMRGFEESAFWDKFNKSVKQALQP
jgi:peroxiredoxin